jgi:hypothetical protein
LKQQRLLLKTSNNARPVAVAISAHVDLVAHVAMVLPVVMVVVANNLKLLWKKALSLLKRLSSSIVAPRLLKVAVAFPSLLSLSVVTKKVA